MNPRSRWLTIGLTMTVIALMGLTRLFAAATLSVPSTDYPNIQSAIDAAVPGDTISVSSGSYQERLSVTKSDIYIVGAGPGKTFINITGTAVTFQNSAASYLIGFGIQNARVGVSSLSSSPYLINSVFSSNTTAFQGSSSGAALINNVFYGNSRGIATDTALTVKNNIISSNARYGIAGTGTSSLSYNLFYSNVLGNYSGGSIGSSDISGSDPIFANSGWDFHLQTGSPAKDTGDPDSSYYDYIDGSTNDIGAYGGPYADPVPATISGVEVTGSADSVTVSWYSNLAYNIDHYKVYYGTTSGELTDSVDVYDTAPDDTDGDGILDSSYTFDTSLISENTLYYFAVTAVESTGVYESDKSAEESGSTDTVAPTDPTNLTAEVGDGRLYLNWEASTDEDSGIGGYYVYYYYYVYDESTLEWLTIVGSVDTGSDSPAYELGGLTNGVTYYVYVQAYDNVGNVSGNSNEVSETPETIIGIKGLKSSGGCFIATAAYGSYEERHVKLLRDFRDRILLPFAPGKAFVSLYYRFSPPVAEFITDHPWLKPVIRVLLLPLIAASWLALKAPLAATMVAVVLILGFFRLAAGRWPLLSSIKTFMLVLVSGWLLFSPLPSYGDELSGYSFSARYGQIFHESNEWEEIYKDDMVSNVQISLDYRFNPFFTAEAGAGYYSKNGSGNTLSGRRTTVKSAFQTVPLDATILFRMNFSDEQFLIPFAGAGLSYNLYWETLEDGDRLEGGMWGYHMVAGAQFLLDLLDMRNADTLKEDYGITNTYLTLRAVRSVVDDFGNEEVDLGGWNYQVGLTFDF